MRALADAFRLGRFFRELARETDQATAVYLTGGATAVLVGWRDTTLDADLIFVPEHDSLFRALPRLKEELRINVEIASPAHFIPELPDWQSRSPLVVREGSVAIHHYDFYAQALAKLQRGHEKDLGDVGELRKRGLIEPGRLGELFQAIQPALYRYPAVDPRSFEARVEAFVAGTPSRGMR